MKNFLKAIPFILFLFCFTSCVDYVQSITYKNGKYQIYYKITLSKVLFAMMDQDPDEIFEEFDDETLNEFPERGEIKPVNTDLEIGAEIILKLDPKTNDETEKSFLPKVSSNKCFIPFLLGNNDSISESVKSDGEAMAQAILSSAKCRVLISKNIIPVIETAYFSGKGGQNYSIPVYDYGDVHCLEVPFPILFEDGKYRTDRIVVIKGE